ncbi:MAG: hypothetical protein ABS904_00330 [Solibacillus isronensis]
MTQLTIAEVVRDYIDKYDVAPSHFTTKVMEYYLSKFPDGQVTRERACQFLAICGEDKCIEPWNINVIAFFEDIYNITKNDFAIDKEASYEKYKQVGVEHYGLYVWKVISLPEQEKTA